MKEESTRQSAAMRARMRRMRVQYRRRIIIVGVLLFILGVVAGIFAHRWYAGAKPTETALPDTAVTVPPEATEAPVEATEAPVEATEAPVEEAAPEASEADSFGWELFDGSEDEAEAGDVEAVIFPEDDESEEAEAPEGAEAIASGEDLAFPEVEAPVETPTEAPAETPTEAPTEAPTETPTEAPTEAPVVEAEPTPVPEMSSEDVAEYDPAEAEVPEEYLNLEDENGQAEGAPAEDEAASTEEAESTEEAAPVEEAAPAEEAAPTGPQVIAIVPYGESFTYSTQIKADGNARVEATDEPYETVSFTQTMKSFLRPTDFANKYSTKYKLQGNEAGAGFELVLNDYTGDATVVPQNVVDISLRSESGNTLERGYQLMDAEIAGNYNVALNTNVPQTLYKRYQYANTGEEMFYLVVTTYNDGVAQQILFQLESDEPEQEPEIVYTTLQRGVKSDEVQALQQRLIDLGYLSGTADGSFGQMTEDAIKAAQEAFGMEVTGIADNAFQQKLYEGVEPPVPAQTTYETLNTSSTGEAVMNMQLRLRELGFYSGKADGGYGPMTESAVKKAQTAYGMEATGIADDAFLQRLYSNEQ